MAKRIVVIGAGPGGLASAMQLAKAGAEVTVLEAQPHVGGRCSAIEADGFRFDVGPTFFLYPRVLREIFASVGYDLDREVPMKRLDPQYRLTFGAGGMLDCTPDIAEMEKRIANLSPKDEGAITRYMRDNRIKLERFRPILESPFSSLLDLIRPAVLAAAPWVRPWKSLGQELESYFSDPRLTIAFSFQSKYLGMSPFRCPSLFSILSYLEYEYGVFHPIGGCARVSERMAEIAEELGAVIHTEEPVLGLEFDGRRVTHVRTGRDTYPVDAIVVNADFAHAMKHLVPNHLRKRWSDTKLEQKDFSCSTFMLYLGVDGTFPELPHHNIHITTDYERNLRQIEKEGVLPDDPSFYVQNPCITDPSLAPDGQSALYVLVPVPNLKQSSVEWNEETRQRYRSLTLKKLEAIGLHDLSERIVFEKMITPEDWREQRSVYAGATFNLAHGLNQMLHNRPRNRFEELDGVYLVGGGTHPGSGLPVIYESSRITSKLLLPDLGMDASFLMNPEQAVRDVCGRSPAPLPACELTQV